MYGRLLYQEAEEEDDVGEGPRGAPGLSCERGRPVWEAGFGKMMSVSTASANAKDFFPTYAAAHGDISVSRD